MSNPGAWARAGDGHWTTRKDVPDITFAVTRPVSSPPRSFQGTVWGITGYPSLPGQQAAVQPPNSHSSRIAARRQDHAAQRAAILSRGGDSPGRVVKATAEDAAAEQAAAERAAAEQAAAEQAAAERAAAEQAAAEQVLTHRPPYGFVSHAEWSPPVPFVSHAES